MALGRNCGEEEVRYSRELRRKRIVISNDFDDSRKKKTPSKTKKLFVRQTNFDSLLESLPQEILIRVFCGVNHDDLKQLFHVSKSIREATLIAKQSHFAYCTPSKTRVFPKSIDFSSPDDFGEIEAPNAPKQWRTSRPRMSSKKLADISIALFSSPNEDRWLNKEFIIDEEV